jgi:hypothetical protein
MSRKQVEGAMAARRLMGMVATLSLRNFEGMVRLNILKTAPSQMTTLKNILTQYLAWTLL